VRYHALSSLQCSFDEEGLRKGSQHLRVRKRSDGGLLTHPLCGLELARNRQNPEKDDMMWILYDLRIVSGSPCCMEQTW